MSAVKHFSVLVGLALACALFGFSTSHAISSPLIVDAKADRIDLKPHSRIWIDEAGSASPEYVDQLPEAAFQPLSERRSAPAGPNQAVWLRFDLVAKDDPSRVSDEPTFWMVAQQVSIDYMSLYMRNQSGQWEGQHAGTAIAVADWPYPSTRPAFALKLNAKAASRVLIRAQDPYGSWTGLSLWQSEQWIDAVQTERMVVGIYLGVTLVVVLLALINAIAWREISWVGYAGYHFLMAGGQLALLGLLGTTLLRRAPWWNEYSIFTLVSWSAVAYLVFCAHVSQAKRFAPRWRLAALGLAGLVAAACILFARFRFGASEFFAPSALPSNTWWARPDAFADALVFLTFFSGVLGVGLFVITGWRGYRLSRWMLLPMTIVLLSAAPQALYSTGFIERSFLTQYGFVVGLLLEAIAMMVVLMKQSRHHASTQTRIESLGLRDALTGLATKHASLQEINSILRMCTKRQLKVQIVVAQIENWANLTKQHGHDVSEHAILVTAHHLTSLRKAGDVVVRLGYARFLLVGMQTDEEYSTRVLATSIVAKGLTTDILLDLQMMRDVRVWTAEVEPTELSAQMLIEFADQAASKPFNSQNPRRVFPLWDGVGVR